MITEIFNKSIYFNIRGTVIELPLSEMPYRAGKQITDPLENYLTRELLQQSEWCTDYTGKLFKNRRPTVHEAKEFLNSGRKSDYLAKSLEDAIAYYNITIETIKRFNEMGKTNKILLDKLRNEATKSGFILIL